VRLAPGASADAARAELITLLRGQRKPSFGAGALRLVRQLLAENLALAACAALLGIGLAQAGIRVLLALAPDTLPRAADIELNLVVLAFALAVTALAGLAVGLAPALAARRSAALVSARRATTRTSRFEHVLLAAQVTLSMVLLASAALLVRSLAAQSAMAPGFAPDSLLAVRIRGSSRPTNEEMHASSRFQMGRVGPA
jgi:hypothetical protein